MIRRKCTSFSNGAFHKILDNKPQKVGHVNLNLLTFYQKFVNHAGVKVSRSINMWKVGRILG